MGKIRIAEDVDMIGMGRRRQDSIRMINRQCLSNRGEGEHTRVEQLMHAIWRGVIMFRLLIKTVGVY
jgi:hypothetical protein